MISVVLRRYRWILSVVAILIGSWLLADTVNAVIAGSLVAEKTDTKTTSRRSMPSDSRRESVDVYLASIRSRNIFDSANRAPDEEDVPVAGEGDLGAEGDAEGCTAPITVFATLPVINDPQRSRATIEDRSESPSTLDVYQVGDVVGGDGILAFVDSTSVQIQRGERRERCEIDGEKGRSTNVAIAAPKGTKPTGKGIQRIGATKFVIAQEEVTAALNNLSSLATEARIVPYFENGESKGFKLYSIKPNSLIAKVGIMNGDIIQKVNGYDINSPEKALQVYSLLKSENRISIDITRNGRPKTFQYEIK